MENFVNILFPPKCEVCKDNFGVICEKCLKKVRFCKVQRCIVCDKFSKNGVTHINCAKKFFPSNLYCVFEYEDIVKKFIKISKYNSRKFSTLKALIKYGLAIKGETLQQYRGFKIVPIPLSRAKMKRRGFNQAELIAREVSRYLKLPVSCDLLYRTKDTAPQHKKTRLERHRSLSGAFLASNKVTGHKILLIDDITTTGGTFLECSKVLFSAGAADVKCFALSKTLKNL